MGHGVLLARVTDRFGTEAGRAVYSAEPRSNRIEVREESGLQRAPRVRSRFRRVIAAHAAVRRWDTLCLVAAAQTFRVVPLPTAVVPTRHLAQAYRAIWANAEIYRKAFSLEEAESLVRRLENGLVMLDQSGDIVGLVGGHPVAKADFTVLASLVRSPDRSTYLQEWGLVDSSAASAYRGLGLGTLLLSLYLLRLVADGQSEVILLTAERGYGTAERNPARPLYEAHGFTVCRGPDGRPITQAVTHLRGDGLLGTHTSVFYRATAEEIQAALGSEATPLEAFQLESLPIAGEQRRGG